MRTFKLLIFGTLLLLSGSLSAQVTSVDYQLKYDTTECQYDAYIIINAGTATTVPQRIQFNAQYSIVVPTGTALTVTESYMPLQNNATYTGTVPLTWAAGTPVISPAAQPESDFYSITPDLGGITAHYNNLAAGDTVKIFSIAVDTVSNCSQGIRIYENGSDPDSNAEGMGMADFSNGFTLGSINQIYSANSTQLYPPEPAIISISNACSDGVEIDLTAETSTCQDSLTFAWTGPDGYTGTSEDVNITPALPVNNGIYKVVITDAFGCKDSITIDATSKPDAGVDSTVCAGSSTIIYGTSPTTGTWAQSTANTFGASLSPLAGGATEVTFSAFATGTYDMVYSIPGCSDTMTFTVNPAPLVNVASSSICENANTVAASNIPGGTWASNDPSVATIDPVSGLITGVASGVATFTYTAPTGCTANTSALTVNPGPTVTVTGGDTICVGGVTFVTPTSGGVWSSSNPGVATVTATGIVTGISAGTTTLTFTDTFTGCTSDGLDIVVTALPVATFTGSDSICVNGTTTLAPNTGGTWVSSNSLVATVDNFGNVTGVSVGTAIFTFTDLTTGCSSLPSDTLWVLDDPTVAITGDDRLCIGETSTVSPNTGGTWTSLDPSIATIDANTGLITAVAQGATTFTFTDSSTGCTATTPALIVDPVPTVSVDFDSICITATAELNPNVGGTWSALNPAIASLVGTTVTGETSGDAGFLFTADATGCVSDTLWINVAAGPTTTLTGPNQICIGQNTTIEPNVGGTWSSSDPTIATIDNFGNITGVGAGTAVFTFTSSSTLCASDPSDPVNVQPAPIVSAPQTNLCINDVMNLTPAFGGTWVSSDPTVATVNAFTGEVTAVSDGSVDFTFTSASTGCSATTPTITVNETPDVEFTSPDTICEGFTTAVSPVTGGTWASDNPSVATVDNLGNVTGVSAGTANLTYTDTNTGCSSATLTVTVLAATTVSITGVDELCITETTTLSPTTGGTWISNDPLVATVTNGGVVTAVGPGQATFTFTADTGQCQSNDTDPITVNGPETIVLADTELCIGETTTATTTALGTWTSNDPAVATIDAITGVITAVSAGTVTFSFTNSTTTCVSNESAELTVNDVPVVSVTGPNEICVGETTQLFPSVGGTWTSSDPSIASIENNGLVTANAAGGPVTFNWTDNATGCTSNASDPITVTPGPGTTVNDDELCIGETTQLLPSSGGTWTSGDPSIATVTSGGLVQGVSAGVTNFTFTSSTTGCSSEPTDPITVHGYISTVITGDAIICINGTSQMSPTSGGTWTSSNPAVATIDNSGFVTGVSTGQATFTFTPTATGCPSLPSDPIEVSPAPVPVITGSSDICIGATTTLSPTSGGVWTSSNPNVAMVNNAGIVTAVGVGSATFTFTETASGCSGASSTAPITITNCLDPDINATYVDVPVDGDVSTNDEVDVATTYGPTPLLTSSPSGSLQSITMNGDGTYTFTANTVGVYVYDVPACIPPVVAGCQTAELVITVVDYLEPDLRPVANLDIATTQMNVAVTLISLENDRCVVTNGCDLDATSVTIVSAPRNGGTTSINGTTGDITYTPPVNFIGNDTLRYSVCVDGEPLNCAEADQIISVFTVSADNSTVAADDFTSTQQSTPVTGNVSNNDSDPEGDSQSVTPQTTTVAAGTLVLLANGDYTFTPAETFFGPVEFPYTTTDDNVSPASASATLHILVVRDLTIRVRVYLEGSLLNNGNEIGVSHTRPLMRDDLRESGFTAARYIPDTDPYKDMIAYSWEGATAKYEHVASGLLTKFDSIATPTAVFGVTGEDAITDWVYVELRDKADNTTVLATRSGLVQRDGDVAELDGTWGLRFPGMDVDDYYVVVKHRNHLGAMTAAPQTPTQLFELVDFTVASTGIFDFGATKFGGTYDYTGLSQNANSKPGYLALWGGDFDGNGKIKYSNPGDDLNNLLGNVLGYEIKDGGGVVIDYNFFTNFDFAFGYQDGDYDMNSKSKYDNPNDDKNMLYGQLLFYPLNAQFLSNFDFFIEQIPE
ncbi:MAG: Ig-like domain-containing protein [Saprospiraceae bacterium]|nr:Ig-like domain-containing protein [Saprospiraceae bacterium]